VRWSGTGGGVVGRDGKTASFCNVTAVSVNPDKKFTLHNQRSQKMYEEHILGKNALKLQIKTIGFIFFTITIIYFCTISIDI